MVCVLKKAVCLIILIVLIACTFSGCYISSDVTELIPYRAKESHVPTGIVSKSGELELYWDAERCSLSIDNNGKTVWASMPLEQFYNDNQTGAVKKYLESHIIVSYKDYTNNSMTSAVSYIGANENGRIYSYLVENGIQIVYIFDKECFAIPVIYRLIDGYLDVMVDNKNIYESANQIYEISLLPYSCAMQNSKENRIFIPDGSGMIMNCDDLREQREYHGDIYGEDGAESSEYKFLFSQSVKLPVFAMSDSNAGNYCTVITGGEAAAAVNATVGDKTMGFSYAYSSFKLRGAEQIQVPQGWGKVSVTSQYSNIINIGKMRMRFYILENDPSFMNVADCYRNYLIKEKGLTETTSDKSLYIDLPMALSEKEFIFGFPHYKTVSVTNYNEVVEIAKDIKKQTGISPIVRLSGIQVGGLEVTKVAGGFKLEKALGSKSDFNSMVDSLKFEKISLYPDFDITRFRESSSGISVKSNSIKTATSRQAVQNFISVATGGTLKNEYNYRLLTPYKFTAVAQNLIELLNDNNLKNVSLSTYGDRAYSDYGYSVGYVGFDYLQQFDKTSKMFKKGKKSVMYDSANQFAAVNAACIVNAPVNTGNYFAEDSWFPFYEIVFKGYVPMAGSSITLSDNIEEDTLRCIQCGIGLFATATGKVTSDYSRSKFSQLSAGDYNSVKGLIKEYSDKATKTIDSVKNCKIISFSTVGDNVYETEFDNSLKIIVNYNRTPFENGEIKIDGQSFLVVGEVN